MATVTPAAQWMLRRAASALFAVALVVSALPGAARAEPEEPLDPTPVSCVLSNGCPGERSWVVNRYGPCVCAGGGATVPTTKVTNTGTGCELRQYAQKTCDSSCNLVNEQVTGYRSTRAVFSQGLRAFNRVECGGKTAGTCPFVAEGTTTYSSEYKQTWKSTS